MKLKTEKKIPYPSVLSELTLWSSNSHYVRNERHNYHNQIDQRKSRMDALNIEWSSRTERKINKEDKKQTAI